MLEVMSSVRRGGVNPGPQELIGYYETPDNPSRHHGFFGEVASSEIIFPLELVQILGLSGVGVDINNDTTWLKFLIDSEIIYIPKKPIKSNISRNQLYNKKAIYENGVGNPLGQTPLEQTLVFTIKSKSYSISLIKGATNDPSGTEFGIEPTNTQFSEWNRLFYNITSDETKLYQEGPQWVNYSLEDLGISPNTMPGCLNICQERHSYSASGVVCRGYGNITRMARGLSSDNSSIYGWRPKLRLIQT